MNNESLMNTLLLAEHEDDVLMALEDAGYSVENDANWIPLGHNPGNFSVVGNQQEDPAAALIEKVVNSIDAVLLGECYQLNIDPESEAAPNSMQDAVEQFFNAPGGRLDRLDPSERTKLADRIHLVATGDKRSPCYCVIDRGEGQTPNQFSETFLSTSRSSPKIRIDFVQGKFNAGGSGSLQFCGKNNLQLVVSRRQPYAIANNSESSGHWGFTVIRRRRPRDGERSSVFVYLAPGGGILSFFANSINVLPGNSSKNNPAKAYSEPLNYGTVVKLYNYRMSAGGIATLETRRQLERALHTPCLPFRISETRDYRANYYATTVAGVWNTIDSKPDENEESKKMEAGFPAGATLSLRDIGKLPIRIGVWRSNVSSRHVPTGIFFLVNGQVHGRLSADFVSRRLKFDYIRDHILVSVDCTKIDRSAAEDLFMASRDRLRKNEHYEEIRDAIAEELANHQGLKDLNAARRKERVESAKDSSSEITNLISNLIRRDPGLANLFGLGDKIVTSVGFGIGKPFKGKHFPTYFRLANQSKKNVLRKSCPINRTVKIEFETDAENEYFDRALDPGELQLDPDLSLIESSSLWNGIFKTRFRVPWDAEPGDITKVCFKVYDVERIAKGPFVSEFELVAAPEKDIKSPPERPERNPVPKLVRNKPNSALDLPNPQLIKKAQWSEAIGIQSPYHAIRIKSGLDSGYDFWVNEDCAWLLTEMSRKQNDPDQIKHWFKWGLTLAALGMIRQQQENGETHSEVTRQEENGINLDEIGQACDGLARVIVPIIRVLYDGPPSS